MTRRRRLLIDSGANVNAVNELGATPLWLGAINGSSDMLKQLLEAGANPNVALSMGETPLMAAARSGNPRPVKLLLEAGANVNTTESEKGQDALMWAVAQQHADVVKVLISHGADLHARSKFGINSKIPRVIPTRQVIIAWRMGDRHRSFLSRAMVT